MAHLASSSITTHVEGSIWPTSIFWTTISIGDPAVMFPVAIDSGSFTLNVPDVGCKGCITAPPNSAYDHSKSSTSDPVPCSAFRSCDVVGAQCKRDRCVFVNTYETCNPVDPTQPCTITGPYYSDVVSVGGSAAVRVDVGAIESQTAGFYQFETVDGVMGMAGPDAPSSVFWALVKDGKLDDAVWALCLNPNGPHANGTIALGGVPDNLYHGEIKYTPNAGAPTGSPFYEMTVNAMSLGSSKMAGVEGTVIIDTGTNDLLLNDKAYASMHSILLDGCSTHNYTGVCGVPAGASLFDGVCFDMSPADVAAFPDITLSVPGIELVMGPEDYLLKDFGLTKPTGKTCLAVGSTGDNGLFIVGDTLLVNYLIVFDRANKQIGFAPVDTSTCGA